MVVPERRCANDPFDQVRGIRKEGTLTSTGGPIAARSARGEGADGHRGWHVIYRDQIDLASLVTIDSEDTDVLPVVLGGPSADTVGPEDNGAFPLPPGFALNLY